MTLNRACVWGISILLACRLCFAVSGIGVHDIWGAANILRAVHVKDNAIADSFQIAQGSHCAINTYGAHAAFFHKEGGIAIVRTDIRLNSAGWKEKRFRDIQGPFGDIEWPRGNWVWYGISKGKNDENRELWRLNVQTGQSQKVVDVGSGIRFRMSVLEGDRYVYGQGFGGRCYFKLPDPDTDNIPVAISDNGQSLENGGYRMGGGCGASISPSGTYVEHQTGSAHTNVIITKVDYAAKLRERAAAVSKVEWNLWSVDEYFKYETCADISSWDDAQCNLNATNYKICQLKRADGTFCLSHHLGGGNYDDNFWSCNSDYWACNLPGWPGRFMDFGGNIAIINWKDSLSMNISRYPAKAPASNDVFGINRNPDNVDSTMTPGKCPRHGDFWISAPLEDVHPELRDDVANRMSYRISSLDEGLIVNAANGLNLKSGNEIAIRATAQGLSIYVGAAGGARIELLSVDGKIACTIQARCPANIAIPGYTLKAGAYMARIRCADAQFVKKIIMQ